MSAPKFVPVATTGAFRDGEHLPPALAWNADRPAEVAVHQPRGDKLGSPGPGQGYALKLANRFHGKLELGDGEHEHDVILGCLGVANKRASLFGRSPVIHDVEVAFHIFGFLSALVPNDLRAYRRPLFEAAGHHYEVQRQIADLVPEATLRMSPKEIRTLVDQGGWRTLLEAQPVAL
jgi:hypothetical protein